MCMVYIAYVKIMVTGKNRILEYRIHVYAGHLSFLGKWSFLIFGPNNKCNKTESEGYLWLDIKLLI